jgi:hypothetical protein
MSRHQQKQSESKELVGKARETANQPRGQTTLAPQTVVLALFLGSLRRGQRERRETCFNPGTFPAFSNLLDCCSTPQQATTDSAVSISLSF